MPRNARVVTSISSPSLAAVIIGTASATANITDNDTPIADLSVTMHGGEAGLVNIIYTVTLSKTNNTGSAIKKRDDTHKMAQANKAFAHYRW